MRDILAHHSTIPAGIVVAPTNTKCANKIYSSFIPLPLIHNEYSPKIIANVLGRQQRLDRHISCDLRKRGSTEVDPRAFLVLDDCLSDEAFKNKDMRKLFLTGRCYRILFVLTMAYVMNVPPVFRSSCIDYVFIFREINVRERMRIYQQYGSMFPDFETFDEVLSQCTREDHACMVIDNTTSSNRIEDIVFKYKATAPPEEFRMCSQAMWDMCAASS